MRIVQEDTIVKTTAVWDPGKTLSCSTVAVNKARSTVKTLQLFSDDVKFRHHEFCQRLTSRDSASTGCSVAGTGWSGLCSFDDGLESLAEKKGGGRQKVKYVITVSGGL